MRNFINTNRLNTLILTFVFVSSILTLLNFNYSWFSTEQSKIFTNLFLLNQNHVLITFLLLFGTTTFETWKVKFKALGCGYKIHLGGSFCVFFVVNYALLANFFKLENGLSILIYGLIYQVYGAQHFLYQSFGLSQKISGRYRNQEKKIIHLIYGLFIASLFAYEFLDKSAMYFKVMVALAILCSVLVLYNLFKINSLLSGEERWKKIIFNSRFILYPLKRFSPWFEMVSVFSHTSEYISFSDEKIKSNYKKSSIIIFFIVQLVFILGFLTINSTTVRNLIFGSRSPLYIIIAAAINSLIYVHFYFDRLMYSSKTGLQE